MDSTIPADGVIYQPFEIYIAEIFLALVLTALFIVAIKQFRLSLKAKKHGTSPHSPKNINS
jgi:hypothetical protein